MVRLLLIDAALCVVLIIAAVTFMVWRWRRRKRSRRPPVPVGVVPGFSADAMEPGRSARVAAAPEPAQGAGSQAGGPPGPEQAAEYSRSTAEVADSRPAAPAGEAAEQRDDAGGVIRGERIGSYYDEADRPMSDYLASMGWTGQPGAGASSAPDTDAADEQTKELRRFGAPGRRSR
jgi:hypothetical protein